jgi:ABC-type Mn2+/Zn2+ transport system ATPase subunit
LSHQSIAAVFGYVIASTEMSIELKSVKFHNFKVLRHATLPLGRFFLLVGPNGSGKSTVIEAEE